jgi:hypothetical protein
VFESWKVAVVVATLIYGLMDFAAKVALGRGCRSRRLMLFSSLSVALLALFSLFFSTAEDVDWGIVALYAMANSLTYGLGYIGQLETLRRLDANAAFPLVKTASAFAVLMASSSWPRTPRCGSTPASWPASPSSPSCSWSSAAPSPPARASWPASPSAPGPPWPTPSP